MYHLVVAAIVKVYKSQVAAAVVEDVQHTSSKDVAISVSRKVAGHILTANAVASAGNR